MASTKKHVIARITNDRARPMIFVLEPWGDVFKMQPSDTFEVLSDDPPVGALDVDTNDRGITVYGWIGSSLSVTRNGRRPPMLANEAAMNRFLTASVPKPRPATRKRRVTATARPAA